MEIIDKIRELLSNLLKEKEIELVDLTYKRQGPDMVLRLTVDKKGGVTVDECAWVNEALGELLDKDNIISDRYLLEVSSPGLDRPLKIKKDFDRVKGEMIRIVTYGPVENRREHIGKIISCDEEAVTIALREANETIRIPLNKIAKARLEIEF